MTLEDMGQEALCVRGYAHAYRLLEACAGIEVDLRRLAEAKGYGVAMRQCTKRCKELERKILDYLDAGSVETAREYLAKLIGYLQKIEADLNKKETIVRYPAKEKPATHRPDGRPIQHRHRSIEERFWAFVDKSAGPKACWPWRGRLRDGVAMFSIHDKSARAAHLLALELTLRRPVQRAKRGCGHGWCVNPACAINVMIPFDAPLALAG